MESQKTVLYENHIACGAAAHMADFSGYTMPLWYSSISAEHAAVRTAAGLFDCTHMGVFRVSGPDAEAFLNFIATNDVKSLKTAHAQYSYLLDPAGDVIDDIIIYKVSDDNFMVVVNAGNEPKVKKWFASILDDKTLTQLKPTIVDLRSPAAGQNQRVDIALQGPASIACLKKICTDDIEAMKSFTFIRTQVGGIDVILSTTGYTGSKVSFEFYVHPENAPKLWNLILETGKDLGILPCGLGSRDSLRIQAGLPLYGHELAGDFNIPPFEAGYGWAVKTDKPDFIGKDAIIKKSAQYDKQVARLEFVGQKGIRPLRQNDAILDSDGKCIGWVLSCAKIDDKQIAISFISRDSYKQGQKVAAYYLARNQSQKDKGKKDSVVIGEKLQPEVDGVMASRFEKF